MRTDSEELEAKVRSRTAELELSNLELTRAYRHLQEAQARLLQSEKLAALGQLVAGIAHEINTPVTTVVGNVTPLLNELERLRDRAAVHGDVVLDQIGSRMQAITEVMARGAERTAGIVQDLRVFSHAEETRPLPMDLHEGLDVSLRLLRPRWADLIDIHRENAELPPVEAAAGQINQVLMSADRPDARNGNVTVKVAPWPGQLSTWISPPCSCTMLALVARPSPVPSPTGLIVKKGSKIRPRRSAGIPQPSSRMVTMAAAPSQAVRIQMFPIVSIASQALASKFKGGK